MYKGNKTLKNIIRNKFKKYNGKEEKMDKLKTAGQDHWLRLKIEKEIQQIEFSNITWNCLVWWAEPSMIEHWITYGYDSLP